MPASLPASLPTLGNHRRFGAQRLRHALALPVDSSVTSLAAPAPKAPPDQTLRLARDGSSWIWSKVEWSGGGAPPKPRLRWTSSIAVPPKSKDHLSWLAFCRTSTPNLGAWIGLSLHPRDGRGRGGASAAPPTRGRCLSALSDCWLYPSLLARKAGECALPLLSTRPRTAVLQQGLVIIIPPTQSPPLPTAPSLACPLLIPLPYCP
jgi:hypothetical protein